MSNQIEVIPSNLFSNNLNLELINLNNNQIKYIGSGVFDRLTKLIIVFLSGNICVDEYFSDIVQLKHEITSKCNNPNDLIERITNLQQENKESKAQLSKANEDLQLSRDVLKKDQCTLKSNQGTLKSNEDALKNGQDVLKKDQDVLKVETLRSPSKESR